ncbi:uncharacterized protein LOC144650367 [Oculina patagonica]
MVVETLKEFLTPKHFSMFGYTIAVLYLFTGIIFSAVTTVFIGRESGNFVCDVHDTPSDKDYVRLQCYEKYKQQYSPFPLFGFALLSFGTMLCVCIAYSFNVKSRIERIEALKPDPENPRPRAQLPPVTTRCRVFKFYSLHLGLRLILGIMFIVLQQWLYNSGFPATFDCTDVKTRKPTTNQTRVTSNSTGIHLINCHSSSQNASWAEALLVINIIFAVLVFLELFHLGYRVCIQRNKDFMQDLNFCKQHLNLFSKSDPTKTCNAEWNTDKSTCLEPLIGNSESKEEGAKLTLDNIVDALVYTGRGDKKLENWMEQHEMPDSYLNPRDGAVQIKKSEALFTVDENTDKYPRKIIVVGCPGSGKSVFCKKLIQDLRKKKLQTLKRRFKYSFFFEFSSFNLTTEKISLKTLLGSRNIESDSFQDILDNPEKVLLVFDGLDEFKEHPKLKAEYKQAQARSITEEMPFLALYANLLNSNQNLLPEATVLTTCRSSEWHCVKEEWFCRIAEIIGYTEKTVVEYINKHYCKPDPVLAKKMWKLVSGNVVLLFLCYIPAFCCIICNHLNWLISKSLPLRLTEVYEVAMKVCFLTRDHGCKAEEFNGTEVFTDIQEDTLSKLGSLAIKGIKTMEQMFGAKQVKGMENCGLLHRLPDSQISHYDFKENYCFLQLSFQKFLAAREIAKMEPCDLTEFFKSNASDPKWHLVIQFVAGLLHGQESEAVDTVVNLLCDSLTQELSETNETHVRQKALLMMKCLYEYNSETIVKKAAHKLQKNREFKNKIDLSRITNQTYQVSPFDCTAIVYFIKYLEFIVLNLGVNSITSQCVSNLCDALSDGNCKLTMLDLSGNKITDEGLTYLCNAFNVGNCTVLKLDLHGNKITDAGVLYLCADSRDALIKSQLTKLDLSDNEVTYQGVSYLCDVLKDIDCNLTVLSLSHNNITDQGASHLHDALKDPRCKLTKLYLSRSKITNHGVSQLCDALKHQNCKLSKLNLSHNNITAQGVLHLCDALKDVKCKLLKLYLSKIKITDESVLHLCDSLKNCKLAKLNLSHNKIADQSVLHLCGALKDVNCKLTKLNLVANNVTDQGVSHLCDALKNVNNKPFKLNLGSNNITDQGVSLLCDALKDVNCKLTEVKIPFNAQVTDEGYKMLAEALRNKQSTGLQRSAPNCLVM